MKGKGGTKEAISGFEDLHSVSYSQWWTLLDMMHSKRSYTGEASN